MKLDTLSDIELVRLYPALLRELKRRGVIRTRNLVGELGKFIVRQTFNSNSDLNRLSDAPTSQKNYSFSDASGDRYNLKTTSGKNTGVFHSVPIVADAAPSFEKLIILMFSNDYKAEIIYMISWDDFIWLRQIKKPEGKWYVQINEELISRAVKVKPLLQFS